MQWSPIMRHDLEQTRLVRLVKAILVMLLVSALAGVAIGQLLYVFLT